MRGGSGDVGGGVEVLRDYDGNRLLGVGVVSAAATVATVLESILSAPCCRALAD